MEDKDQFIGRLLDSALAHRRKAEPRPGLEVRIMESVRTAGRQHAPGGWSWKPRTTGWVLLVATAAVAIVAALVFLTYRQHRPATETQQANRTVSVQPQHKELVANPKATPKSNHATTVLEAKRAARVVKTTARRTEAHRWPAQFPTPAPLTKEEKALIRYVQETPPEVLAALLANEQSAAQPIEIEPLKIPRLEIKPLSVGTAHEETQ